MTKLLLALVFGAVFSCDAFAGYIRYDFSGPMWGYFIQRDNDQSIADFKFWVPVDGKPRGQEFAMLLQPIFGEGSTRLTDASTYFRNNGPTNFRIYSDFGSDQVTDFSIFFSRGTQGNFNYSATYRSVIYGCDATGCDMRPYAGSHSGFVASSAVDPELAAFLDRIGGYQEGVTPIIPGFIQRNGVPEPGSLALLALGAAGLLRTRRKQANPANPFPINA